MAQSWLDRLKGKFTRIGSSALEQQTAATDDAERERLLAEGNGLEDGGQLAAAARIYEAVIARWPDHPGGYLNLGNACLLGQRLAEAVAAYRRALALRPGEARYHFNLARALTAAGDVTQAEAHYREAIQLDGRFAAAQVGLGVLLSETGRPEAALALFEAALRLTPDDAGLKFNRARLLAELGRADEAGEPLEDEVAAMPEHPWRSWFLGKALCSAGLAVEGAEYLAASEKLDPNDPAYASSRIFFANNLPDIGTAELFALHRAYDQRFCARLAPPAGYRHPNGPQPGRRLRIGYVSGDFRRHVITRFMKPVLAARDRAAFEVFCYSNHGKADEETEAVRALADQWRDISLASDAAAAQQVRDDAIDILVDLSGHTDRQRLLLFARKPAPIQVTWLGYLATSGLSAMDYRICDVHTDPPGLTEKFHTEKLARMPHSQWVLPLPEELREVVPAPILKNGYATFGSFNALFKINDAVLATWADLLAAQPGSRLVMAGVPAGRAETRIRQLFSARGIDPARIDLRRRTGYRDYLRIYDEVDVSLDAFPYNGGTTSLDALLVGVPLVALAGDRSIARGGVGLLSNVGLADLIAGDRTGYVDIARALVADPQRLNALRIELRDRVRSSPLTDVPQFCAHLERLYRKMWERWCRGEAPAHLAVEPGS